jgi:hypothetical protein
LTAKLSKKNEEKECLRGNYGKISAIILSLLVGSIVLIKFFL